ncbi:MAG: flagellar biosynthesis protein FlhA [Actinomycetota bacterium]|nr:flagellar biosynthesis protein FlhA [Actinomycetota bacterium]
MNLRQRMGLFGVPAIVIAIVVMLVVPIPTLLLDIMITLNLSFALVVLLTTMHVRKPKDFSTFPTLLLVATLFRLALNVSVTRMVLLHGYAGSVVNAFGNFVVGGQIVVGLVIFLILIVIQFVVVTAGAGRVSEVAARFSLDAMTPKLVAIDSDLSAGLIDREEAIRRRKEIDNASDFYGSMDGASKFVRGDAVAALVIVLVNLIGGFAVGVIEHHDSISQAIHTYSILSVGDGLVSQIPALLLSISTGIIVTRTASTEEDFGYDVATQFGNQPRAVQIAGIAVLLMGLIPGLPHVPFLIVGALLLLFAGRIIKVASTHREKEKAEREQAEVPVELDSPHALAAEIKVEPLQLEIAPNLAPLVDETRGGDLLARIRAMRRKLAYEKGILVPKVRTRDNVQLDPGAYVIRVNGVEAGRGVAPPGRVLAIGTGIDSLPGEATTEPVFNLPAKWIPSDMRTDALGLSGITVVDRASAIVTHLGDVASTHAGELLSMQQVQTFLDVCKASDKVAVDEMAAAQVTVSDLHRVLVSLLDQGVPISDMVRIIEAMTERARDAKVHEAMVEAARRALGPAISAQHARDGVLRVVTIDVAFERQLAAGIRVASGESELVVDPSVAEHLVARARALFEQAMHEGTEPVLLVSGPLRPALQRLFAAALRQMDVLSVDEVSRNIRIERVGVVSGAAVVAA